jgi:hypothetical protein
VAKPRIDSSMGGNKMIIFIFYVGEFFFFFFFFLNIVSFFFKKNVSIIFDLPMIQYCNIRFFKNLKIYLSINFNTYHFNNIIIKLLA